MNYKQCKEYIRSDYNRVYHKHDASMSKMLFSTIWDVGFQFMFWWRLSHLSGFRALLPRLFSRIIGTIHHIEIEKGTDIGYGFWLVHGGPVVINSSAKIGNNCNICQFTTIGSLCQNAAHIGDNVYIGPAVCIVEGVKIGSNVTIGAGSVVVKDVPENATAAGNPAKVISWKEPGRFIWGRWPVTNIHDK